MQSTSRRVTSSDWVSIGRASELLGVNPATIREWANLGKLRAYRTPGGHRRFSAAEIASLAEPIDNQSPAVATDLISRLRQRYHGTARTAATHEPWILGLPDPVRSEFRALGEALLAELSRYIGAGSRRERRLAREAAGDIGSRYGQLCREAGLDTARAVETYLRFRKPLMDVLSRELAAHPESGGEVSRLLRDAETLMDDVLSGVASSGVTGESPMFAERSA
jgi:excisionase family DNA binding protein